ncbi:hypothetical protein ES703_118997 [subsurface metagenome]
MQRLTRLRDRRLPTVAIQTLITVTIYAENALDPYSRYWTIWKKKSVVKQITAHSGYTWSLNLEAGTYKFGVSQAGGPAYGTYSGTINGMSFSGVDHFHTVAFTVGAAPPPAEPYGKIVAIRVQDIETGEWFNYDNGVWDKTPKVTVGSNLYIAAWAINEGDAFGTLTLQIKDDTGAVLATKSPGVGPGVSFGVETGTINMPNRVYDIDCPVDP